MTGDSRPNRPAEVLGYLVEDKSEEAERSQKEHLCPFLREACWKKSRNLDYPFGVCSVWYGGRIVAVCPSRFRQNETVLRDIAEHHFGSLHDLVTFPEASMGVKVRSGRRINYAFDYVLVKHKPLSSKIEDFVLVEFQTVDTTSTGALVTGLRDFTKKTQDAPTCGRGGM